MRDAHWWAEQHPLAARGSLRRARAPMAAPMQTVFSNSVRRTDFVPYEAKNDPKLLREPRVSKGDPWKDGTLVLKSDYDPFDGDAHRNMETAELLWFPKGNDNATLGMKLSVIKAVEYPRRANDLAGEGPMRIVRLITTGDRNDLQTTIMFSEPESDVGHDCVKFVDTLYAFLGPPIVPSLIAKTSELAHLFSPDYVLGIVVLSKAEETMVNKASVATRYGADYAFLFHPDHLVLVKRYMWREGIVNIMISEDQWIEWILQNSDSFVQMHKTLDCPDVIVYFHDSVYRRFANTGGVVFSYEAQILIKRIDKQGGHMKLCSLQKDYAKWLLQNQRGAPEPIQVDLVSDAEPSDKDDEALPEEVEDTPPPEPQKRSIDELVTEFLVEHKRTRTEWETTEKGLKNDLERSRKQRNALFKRLQETEGKHKGVLDELGEQARTQSERADKEMELKNFANQRAQEALDLAGAQTSVAQRALKWRIRNDSGDQPPSMTLPAAGCTVCFDAVAEWACVPCGHIVACNACKDTDVIWKTPKCPLCNAFRFPDNHGLLRVFTSGVCV